MSMFTVTGQVLKTFVKAGYKNPQTGEVSPDSVKVQLLGAVPQPNGETKFDMYDFTVEERSIYDALLGKEIRLPLGMIAQGKGQIVYFIPKGSKPELVEAQKTGEKHAFLSSSHFSPKNG